MTLKTRLAGMMVLVLVAVVAVQFVLAERERRELGERLALLSGEVDRTTSVFVQRAHELAARGGPPEVEALLAEVLPDSDRAREPAHGTVRVFVSTDSAASRTTRTQHIVWMRRGSMLAIVDTVRIDSVPRVLRRPAGARLAAEGAGGGAGGKDAKERDFVINLPLPGAGFDSDSLYTVQMRYSYASLAEELARSRRRSLLWLAALLGLGVAAALGVAGQFTRPIRALEASFGRVEQGDLDVRVQPERRDEIGHLTASFNEMVSRLRESQRLADRLAESEHLASLGRLAAGIAHEIRNPLNAILLNLQQMHDRIHVGMMAQPVAGPAGRSTLDEFDKYHARMTAEIGRLERMVGSFLDLAKSGELHFAPVDVAAGLHAAVDLFRPVAEERGVELAIEAPGALEIAGDPSRLPAVWNNLLANALEATPRGGRVALGARRDGGVVEVVVEDTGPGVPPESRARIWEPFFSGRDTGTGLGLAIVRSTVEHHGGRVEAEWPAGGGTRMRVRLPVGRLRPTEAA